MKGQGCYKRRLGPSDASLKIKIFTIYMMKHMDHILE